MPKAQMMVFAAAQDGQREELDRWYDERHIPDLLAVSGLVRAERYDVRALKVPEGTPAWDFMAIYHLEGEDIGTILGAAAQRMGTPEMPASPALDSSRTLALLVTAKERGA